MDMAHWNAHPHDHPFIQASISALPGAFKPFIRNRYNSLFKSQGRREANLSILGLKDTISQKKLRLASDDDAICLKARNEARSCTRIAAKAKNESNALENLKGYISAYGIPLPFATTRKGIIARLKDEQWWRRQLRVIHGQEVETTAISLNMVNKRHQIYVSDASLARRRGQRQRNRALLESLEAINELGDSFTLQELTEFSVSNPKNRRAELMVRIAGFEQIADELGHVGEFYTLTCPSRMHASLQKSGERNPNYDETTPVQAQKYLTELWARIRTAFSNKGIKVYGLRVVEPHHDGTPHWHMLFFMEQRDRNAVRQIIKKYALMDSPSEPGAEKYRFKAVRIDKSKGTAAGYVAKYISKNIDGYGVDNDTHGRDAKSSSERIEAYSTTWRIRQFQQIGGPPVTVWRELRKLRNGLEAESESLHKAYQAADSGNWAEFVKIMGGPVSRKADYPVKLLRVWSDKPGKYGEPIGDKVIGILCGDESITTHIHEWKIQFKPENPGLHFSGTGKQQAGSGLVESGAGTGTKWAGPSSGTDSLHAYHGAGTRAEWAGTSTGTGSSPGAETGMYWPGPGAGTSTGKIVQGSETGIVTAEHPDKGLSKNDGAEISPPWSSVNNCTFHVGSNTEKHPENSNF